ncbi:hypothetical protein EYF80_062291 [Liparis tanakae]|uniref:Uncharacterized protein n=1 Tax=Liparis tanakae TaxID=230148 RepID=A0A4Z2EGG1_9TELE|nr:hypothetical protein EYF80_062291 [Liparis tanakae]
MSGLPTSAPGTGRLPSLRSPVKRPPAPV